MLVGCVMSFEEAVGPAGEGGCARQALDTSYLLTARVCNKMAHRDLKGNKGSLTVAAGTR